MQLLQCFKTKKLNRNATSTIAEIVEVALLIALWPPLQFYLLQNFFDLMIP